jgi:cyanophycinase-like exopeptidase
MRRAPLLLAPLLLAACPPPAGEDAGPAPREDAGPDVDEDAGPPACAALPAGIAEGRTGSDGDTTAAPRRALVLMGGGAEVDSASAHFVSSAGGGDVLVLRASGSTETYLPYFESEVGADPAPSSVAVLRSDDPAAAADEVACRVDRAEAVWLAGGDQHDYLAGWQSVVHDALAGTAGRAAAIGGTSAGAMALGSYAFGAAEGSVTSAEALEDPTSTLVDVVTSPFPQPELADFLVDTHFTARDREGRLLAFLAHARGLSGGGVVWGVGLDERTALIIENGGFGVRAEAGGSVWLYRFEGEPDLSAGSRLSMSGIERVQLGDGDEGFWPPQWDAYAPVELVVTDGVVSVR